MFLKIKETCSLQALWRGYILRKRLQMALDYARLEDQSDDDDDFFDDEIDMSAFNFNEVKKKLAVSLVILSGAG